MESHAITSKTPIPAKSTEPTPPTNSSDLLISGVYARLLNRMDIYLTANNGQWYTAHQRLTREVLSDALSGTTPLGVMSVSGTGTSRFIAFDADEERHMAGLDALARELHPTGATLYELSRRGAHLFVFIDQTDWQRAREYGLELAERFNIPDIEVFPKHGGLNAIRLPGTTHPKTGERYPIIDPTTGLILDLAEQLHDSHRLEIPSREPRQVSLTEAPPPNPEAFENLVTELQALTHVRIYAPGRGVANCLWHNDRNPSLYIKDGRFHCLRPDCVWGDLHDLKRWIHQGVRPPSHRS